MLNPEIDRKAKMAAARGHSEEIVTITASGMYWRDKLDHLSKLWDRDSEKFNEINLSTFIYSLAKIIPDYKKLPAKYEPLLDKSITRVCRQVGLLPAKNLCDLTWGLAKLKARPARLIKLILLRSARIIQQFKPKTLAVFTWALATLDVKQAKFYKLAIKHVLDKNNISKFLAQPKSLTNMLWGLAVVRPELAKQLIKAMGSELHGFGFNTRMLCQLHHVRIASGAKYGKELNGRIDRALRILNKPRGPVNEYMAGFLDTLRGLGMDVEPEYFIEGYVVDAYDKSKDLVIEFDGVAYHHLRKVKGAKLVGSDVLRDKILKILGKRVIHISDTEWKQEKNKQALIVRKLKEVGIEHSSD